MEPVVKPAKEKLKCHHCGDDCVDDTVRFQDHSFCCNGCKSVYELFQDSGLVGDYKKSKIGIAESSGKYDFLDNEKVVDELLDFQSDTHNNVKVALPAIHCSSCIYLLENLHRVEPAILSVKVNFVSKVAQVHYNPAQLTLKSLAYLLDSIGYAPQFEKIDKSGDNAKKRSDFPIKIGIAAFCFGNIMLLSFPEYLGIDEGVDEGFKTFFSYLNILLALPVLLYSARDYFISAFKGLSKGFVNIDVPIALGIVTLFFRSLYEVLSGVGAGYFDSLAGLVFFLLIGKWFQNKTYDNLSFERDYKSYFPLAVLRVDGEEQSSVPIANLKAGDEIIIRNQEIIPADAVLLSKEASIDYSFVTGEQELVTKHQHDYLYAGGRHVGHNIRLEVKKKSSQSYLTELWNNQVFKKEGKAQSEILINKISKHFTVVILTIALVAGAYWLLNDSTKSWQVITAVLIVACPCALALSAPFTNGNSLRIFGQNKLYLKSADIAEQLADVDTIVFDKTGTLTTHNSGALNFYPDDLTVEEKSWLHQLVQNSTHPISKKIKEQLAVNTSYVDIEDFVEIPGAGVQANVSGNWIKLGSEKFVKNTSGVEAPGLVHVSINEIYRGHFEIKNQYREGIRSLIEGLQGRYQLSVLSGDNDQEKKVLDELFPEGTEMLFRQQPQDKLDYILSLQKQGRKVMMLGDGLNDAGALKQSDIGIAVTEDVSSFSPACDGIVEGEQLKWMGNYLSFGKIGKRIIIASITISFMYNAIGIGFAISGNLTPIFAAILMPLSSVSVVLFTTISGSYFAKRMKLI